MKNIFKFLFILPVLMGLVFAHIPQPKEVDKLSMKQMEEISRVVGDLHKKGASHEELHKAVIKLYKQWNIEFKKVDVKKQNSDH